MSLKVFIVIYTKGYAWYFRGIHVFYLALKFLIRIQIKAKQLEIFCVLDEISHQILYRITFPFII